MATLVFTTLGTALGGPLGGALGALVGNQLDQAIIGSPKREGPRLKELAVTTSTYGSPIPRHFGRVRAPGTIIWATDLKETKEKSGGSKGQPSVTQYAYSASFAVALASRPIMGIGRIWADGNLLRGSQGDLKVGGQLRFYAGHGDQPRDPLIASDRGPNCPAFRNIAYCVFEDLQLARFGNRIPGLTFEIFADAGEVSLEQLTRAVSRPVLIEHEISGIEGFSDEGGPLSASLSLIDQAHPLTCDGSQPEIYVSNRDVSRAPVARLAAPVVSDTSQGIGNLAGYATKRTGDTSPIPAGIRFYDVDRDFQPGLQRAGGRTLPGATKILDFPATLSSQTAKNFIDAARQRTSSARQTLTWRVSEVDPACAPGATVIVPGQSGIWRIETWEWTASGVELELAKVPTHLTRSQVADPGTILPPTDKRATPTLLSAFELPWDGYGDADVAMIFAAPSSHSDGWTGAALYAEDMGELRYLRSTGARRSIIGNLLHDLEPSATPLLDRNSRIEVSLASADFALSSTNVFGLAEGRNRALLGGEVIQFMEARTTGPATWELSMLLRGRGGTEPAASTLHAAGQAFVLLDESPLQIETLPGRIAAIGLADEEPTIAEVANAGLGRQPPCPVHPRSAIASDGALRLAWIRRARGAWKWSDTSEVPLVEREQRYLVGFGPVEEPNEVWETSEPHISFTAEQVAELRASHAGDAFWVKQIGTWSLSPALRVTTLV